MADTVTHHPDGHLELQPATRHASQRGDGKLFPVSFFKGSRGMLNV